MMVAGLHDDEQIQGVCLEDRLGGEAFRIDVFDARSADLRLAPDRLRGRRRIHVVDQRLNIRRRKLVGERGHLRRLPPTRDGLDRRGPAQPLEIFRQQRRPRATQPIGAVAGRAVCRVVIRDGGFRGGHERVGED